MVDVNELRACMARRRVTQEELAKACGMTPKTMYSRMKSGVFKTDEAQIIAEYLNLDNPCEIFFAQCVTYEVTK